MKKYLLIFFILTCASPSFAATYYVKNGGSDAAAGTSPATAWETIGKINSYSFGNSDIVIIRAGDSFNDATLTLGGTSDGVTNLTVRGSVTADSFDAKDVTIDGKPELDGDTNRCIYITQDFEDLLLKDISCVGQEFAVSKSMLVYIGGSQISPMIDGVDIDGELSGQGAQYEGHNGIVIGQSVTGEVEIKNCTISNLGVSTTPTLNGIDNIGIFTGTGRGATVSYLIHDNTINNVNGDCIQTEDSTSDLSIYNNDLGNAGEQSIDIKHSSNVNVYDNTIHMDEGYGEGGSSGRHYGIGINGGNGYTSTDINVYDNYFYGLGLEVGVRLGRINTYGTARVKTYRNKFYQVRSMFRAGTYTVDAEFYNNIGKDCGGAPTYPGFINIYDSTGSSGTLIYNNSILDTTGNVTYGIYRLAGSTGFEVKNNSIYLTKATGYTIYDSVGSGTYSNNLLYNSATANRVYWTGTTYTTATFGSWSGSTNSLTADPQYNSTADFQLWPGNAESPLIGAGVAIGGYTVDLKNSSVWPSAVVTGTKSDPPEIGAFLDETGTTTNWQTSWSVALDTDISNATADHNRRMVLKAADISISGDSCRLRFTGNTGNASVIDHVSICERATTSADPLVDSYWNCTTTPTEVKFGGLSQVTLSTSASQYSDSLEFAIDETKDYLVHLWFNDGPAYIRRLTSAANSSIYKSAATLNDESLYTTPTGYTRSSNIVLLDRLEVQVNPPNELPTCSIDSPTAQTISQNDTLDFNSTAADSDGTIASYLWDLDGGGSNLTNEDNASVTMATVGVFNVTLTVTDNDGGQCQDGPVEITVTAGGGGWSESWTGIALTSSVEPINVADRNKRMILPAAAITTSGTKVRFTLQAPLTANMVISGMSICEQSATSTCTTTPTRITFDSGSNGTTVTANQTTVTDEIIYTIDETKTYLVHGWWNSNTNLRNGNYGSQIAWIKDSTAVDNTLTTTLPGGYSDSNYYTAITKMEVFNIATDTTSPVASSWSGSNTGNFSTVYAEIPICITYDEPVSIISGSAPTMTLLVNTGAVTGNVNAYGSSVSGTSICFQLITAENMATSDLQAASVSAFSLNGVVIQDAAGNDIDTDLTPVGVDLGSIAIQIASKTSGSIATGTGVSPSTGTGLSWY